MNLQRLIQTLKLNERTTNRLEYKPTPEEILETLYLLQEQGLLAQITQDKPLSIRLVNMLIAMQNEISKLNEHILNKYKGRTDIELI